MMRTDEALRAQLTRQVAHWKSASVTLDDPSNFAEPARFEFGGSACGIRTRDLRLERAVSWAARRTRQMAGDGGFEPPHTDPESAVLPLDESPAAIEV
jgi:hypothetical protein